MGQMTIQKWIEGFNNGAFEYNNRKTQIEAGWYDWFCRDTSLCAKTKKMGNIVKQIKAGGKVDFESMYVWFKNNCPLSGPLYDDFRFATVADGMTQFTTQISCCWNKHRYTVYARKNDFNEPIFETDSSRELVKWFNTPWEEE